MLMTVSSWGGDTCRWVPAAGAVFENDDDDDDDVMMMMDVYLCLSSCENTNGSNLAVCTNIVSADGLVEKYFYDYGQKLSAERCLSMPLILWKYKWE